jgi:glucokinase
MSLTIGVDVGGTKVAAGAVDDQGRIIEKLRRSTPSASPELTAAVIAEAAAELLSRHDASSVGVGAAGWVNEAAGTVAFAPNLAWRDEPLRAKVEGMIGRPVLVENDGNASAWAEAKFGAARGYAHVVFISVGTGIGAGFVLDSRLYRGRWGMAGEPGHVRVVPDGRLCGCGNRGCWEQYASGSALTTEARDLARRSPSGATRLLQLAGGDPDAIGGAQVTQAAQEGDPAALRCFGIVGGWLGQGMADLAAILDPGCFVIGGGVSEAGELLIGPARAAFERGLAGGRYRPQVHITQAALGPDAGIVGAADLARLASAGPRLDDCPVVGARVARRALAHVHHQRREAANERGHRAKRRPAWHLPVDHDRDEQVGGAAEQSDPGALGQRVQPGEGRWDRGHEMVIVLIRRRRDRACGADDADLGGRRDHSWDRVGGARRGHVAGLGVVPVGGVQVIVELSGIQVSGVEVGGIQVGGVRAPGVQVRRAPAGGRPREVLAGRPGDRRSLGQGRCGVLSDQFSPGRLFVAGFWSHFTSTSPPSFPARLCARTKSRLPVKICSASLSNVAT